MTGKQAWALLAAGVLAHNLSAKDGMMLSETVDGWLVSHPVTTRLVVAAVALHLINGVPARFDLVHVGFAGIRKVRRR